MASGSTPLALGIGWSRCANGETYEFWLTLDGNRVGDVGVFRDVGAFESDRVMRSAIRAHAASALATLLQRASRNAA